MNRKDHVRNIVFRLGRHLETLVHQEISLSAAFDILATEAHTIEEMVIVEVMREAELETQPLLLTYADSSERSARMPSMAFSR